MKIIKWQTDGSKFQMFNSKRPLELLIVHSQRIVSDYSNNKMTWFFGVHIENYGHKFAAINRELAVCEELAITAKLNFGKYKHLQTDLQFFEENQN